MQFLDSQGFNFNQVEWRCETVPLPIAIAMKHEIIVDFLIPRGNQESLSMALAAACVEGNLELVKLCVEKGADLEYRIFDVKGIFSFLSLEKIYHSIPFEMFQRLLWIVLHSMDTWKLHPIFWKKGLSSIKTGLMAQLHYS